MVATAPAKPCRLNATVPLEPLHRSRNATTAPQLDGIVTTVDAQHALVQLDANFEPAKQIAMADRIVLTKTDLVETAAVTALEARIRALNRSGQILRVVKGETEPSR